MNKLTADLLLNLARDGYTTQRDLADRTGYSLGMINRGVNELRETGYMVGENLTEKAQQVLAENEVKRAVILAAGFGVRMIPINQEVPKGLIEVHGERLIERLIRQLQAAGVTDIQVAVGFQKEQYEYLIDKYGISLVVNSEYATKNNIYSLERALTVAENTYILPCDIWCADNPFRTSELYSWYLLTDRKQDTSFKVANDQRIIATTLNEGGNYLTGIAHLTATDTAQLIDALKRSVKDARFDQAFWEEVLFHETDLTLYARVMPDERVLEINTYEDLRQADDHSETLDTDAIRKITEVFEIEPEEIERIEVLKKGMTNRSFIFTVKGKRYIMRIPGEGTEELIDREQEAEVYRLVDRYNISDDLIYINPDSGYKITAYLEQSRVCDATQEADLELCMQLLREFHAKAFKVEHSFNIFELTDFYEKLWGGKPSAYADYAETKAKMQEVKQYIDAHASEPILSHIDANADNFLIFNDGRDVRLIDWEYAGMHDPAVDVAMFGIYSLYDRQEMDRLIDIYYEHETTPAQRTLVYAYCAVSGLLWSNWCEYKRFLGVDFGDYSLAQYRYAKDYYKILKEELNVL